MRNVWTFFGPWGRPSRPNIQSLPTLVVDTNMFVGALLKEQTELQEELDRARDLQRRLNAKRFVWDSVTRDGYARFQVAVSTEWPELVSVVEEWVPSVLEAATREIKVQVAGIESRLAMLSRRIQAFFSRFRTGGCLRDLIVVQIEWFALHGDHPPHLSDSARIPIQRPGACRA